MSTTHALVRFFSGVFGGSDGRRPVDGVTGIADESYVLCDGIATNGIEVPDLCGCILRGADDVFAVGQSGGSIEHRHALPETTDGYAITVAQMPQHNHTINVPTEYNGVGRSYRQWVYTTTGSTNNTGKGEPHDHPLGGEIVGSSLPRFYVLAPVMYVGQ